MVEKKDDFYITTLKYMRETTVAGAPLDVDAAVDHVKKINPDAPDNMIRSAYSETRNQNSNGISVNAYFQVLEYEELQQARKAAQDANDSSIKAFRLAFGALVVSSALAIASIYLNLTDGAVQIHYYIGG